MIKRYLEIYPYMHHFTDDVEVEVLAAIDNLNLAGDHERRFSFVNCIPTAAEHGNINRLYDRLKPLQVATKNLQSESISMLDVHDYFTVLRNNYPFLGPYISDTAAIVHSPDFEKYFFLTECNYQNPKRS